MAWDTLVTGVLMLASSAATYVGTNLEKWREQRDARNRLRREAIGRALSILLEVYHHAAFYLYLNELFSLGGATEAKGAVMMMAKSILPDLTPLSKEYEEAIRSLAGEYPVLASKIRDTHRHLEVAHQILSMVTAEAEASGVADVADVQRFLDEFSTIMHAEAFKTLDEKVQELATEHSLKTRNEVNDLRTRKARLKWEVAAELEAKFSGLDLPENQRAAVDQLFAVWRNARKVGGAATPTQALPPPRNV